MKYSRSKFAYLAFLTTLLSVSTADRVMQLGDGTVTIDLSTEHVSATAENSQKILQLNKSNLTHEKAFIADNFLCDQ